MRQIAKVLAFLGAVSCALGESTPSYTVSPSSFVLEPGQSQEMVVEGDADVAVSSRDPGIAEVTLTERTFVGQTPETSRNIIRTRYSVTGVREGTTVLRLRRKADIGDPDQELPVTVVRADREVFVNPRSTALERGQSTKLMCTVQRARDGQPQANEAVTWSSSNPAVATISADGTVTAVMDGSATMTCTPQNGQLVVRNDAAGMPTHTATVMVRTPITITISPSNATLNVFSTAQLMCVVRHAVTGAAITGVPLTWTSSVPTIATVSATGLVTGVTPGQTLITCVAPTGELARASVTVIAPVLRRVEVTPTSASLNVGVTRSLTCTVRNAQTGAVITGLTTTWQSSNPSVATVDNNGTVTGISAGTSTITCALQSGESGTAQVTVVAPTDPLCDPQATPQANDLRQFVSIGFPNLPANHYCMSSTNNLSMGPVLHSSNAVTPRPRVLDESSFFMVGGWEADLTAAGAAALNSTYPCGLHTGGRSRTLCKATTPLSPGKHYVMHMVLNGALGFNDPPTQNQSLYQYGFVFDGDNAPANNFRPGSAFPNDYFQGTDTWYKITRDRGQDFVFSVLKVSSGNTPQVLPTNARMIMTSRSLILLIPSADIPSANPGVRLTAFRHFGDFGLNGGQWAGDVQRPITQSLLRVPIPR